MKVRGLSDEEGQRLQRIVRRGGGSTVRYRRALVVLASAGGNSVPVIARLVFADEDRVREVIHRFNELRMASLDPQWAGGRPRRINTEDVAFIVATAQADPAVAGQPFTRWSLRKLTGLSLLYLLASATGIGLIISAVFTRQPTTELSERAALAQRCEFGLGQWVRGSAKTRS